MTKEQAEAAELTRNTIKNDPTWYRALVLSIWNILEQEQRSSSIISERTAERIADRILGVEGK